MVWVVFGHAALGQLKVVFHITSRQSTHDQELTLVGGAAVAITDYATSQLAQLLGRDIVQLYPEARREAIPATGHGLSRVDRRQRGVRLVPQQRAWCRALD